jgi:hypothetical protein
MKYPYKEWWKEPKKLIKRPKLRVRSQRWIYKGILGFEPGNGWLIRLIPHNIAESGKWWSNGSLPHNMAHRLWTINDFAVLSRISRFDDEKDKQKCQTLSRGVAFRHGSGGIPLSVSATGLAQKPQRKAKWPHKVVVFLLVLRLWKKHLKMKDGARL